MGMIGLNVKGLLLQKMEGGRSSMGSELFFFA
jgi:hypothetical protein